MRADIVDRGIEHGATKFIVNGSGEGGGARTRARIGARVKYDDYDRDEIGSRGRTAFRRVASRRACLAKRICRYDREDTGEVLSHNAKVYSLLYVRLTRPGSYVPVLNRVWLVIPERSTICARLVKLSSRKILVKKHSWPRRVCYNKARTQRESRWS